MNCDARLGLGDAFASLLCCEWLCVSGAHASSVMAKTRAAKQMCLHGKLDGVLPLNPAPLPKLDSASARGQYNPRAVAQGVILPDCGGCVLTHLASLETQKEAYSEGC